MRNKIRMQGTNLGMERPRWPYQLLTSMIKQNTNTKWLQQTLEAKEQLGISWTELCNKNWMKVLNKKWKFFGRNKMATRYDDK